jgi:hypothetical protein
VNAPDPLLGNAPSLAAARVIAYAGNLIRAEGYARVPCAGRPGMSLSLAVCTTARCEIMRPQLPIHHTELCYLATARLAGYLYLSGRVAVARGELAEVCGEWERRQHADAEGALMVADGAALALGLTGVRHLGCGYWGQGATPEARALDIKQHMSDAACTATSSAPRT